MAKLLKDVAVGSLVKLNESGVPVEFYVACHDYESGRNGAGRTLLVRKDGYDQRQWHSSASNTYSTSNIDTWLNDTYKSLLDENIQSAIGTTTIYASGTITRGVFLMSLYEMGLTSAMNSNEGSTLPIASTLRKAYLNGTATAQWTRTRCDSNTSMVATVTADGSSTLSTVTESLATRPAFTLSAEKASVMDDNTLIFDDVTLDYGETELGEKSNNFSINYTASADYNAEIAVTEKIDDRVIRTYLAPNGEPQRMTVPVSAIHEGSHTATIIADIAGDSETAIFTFVIPAITPHEGGTVQEFQDENGHPVFPATLAKAVMTSSGESVEKILTDAIRNLGGLIASAVKIDAGSYNGTGTYGTSGRNSITFDFTPKCVIVMGNEYSSPPAIWMYGSSILMSGQAGASIHGVASFNANSNTLSWYNTSNAVNQYNNSGKPYYYVAIG